MLRLYYLFAGEKKYIDFAGLSKNAKDGKELVDLMWEYCRDTGSVCINTSYNGKISVSNWLKNPIDFNEKSTVKSLIDDVGFTKEKQPQQFSSKLYYDSELEKELGFTISVDTTDEGVYVTFFFDEFEALFFNRFGKSLVAKVYLKWSSLSSFFLTCPYASKDGSVEGMMKNMWAFEHYQFNSPQAIYPDECFPMGKYWHTNIFAITNQYTRGKNLGVQFNYTHPGYLFSPYNFAWNNYASFYYTIYKTPLVPVDIMKMPFGPTEELVDYVPACAYDPTYIEAWNYSAYGYDSVVSTKVPERSYGDVAFPKGVVKYPYSNYAPANLSFNTLPLAFVQRPSRLVITEKLKSKKGIVGTGAYGSALRAFTTTDNKCVGLGRYDVYDGTPANVFCFTQIMPFNHLSEMASSAGDGTSLWEYSTTDGQKIPPIVCTSQIYDNYKEFLEFYNGITWDNSVFAPIAAFPDGSQGEINGVKYESLSGNEILEYFYGGKVTDSWKPNEIEPPSNIPEDTGGGGINGQVSQGGNGTWTDTNTDMGYKPDSPIWNLPTDMNLNGNFEIVKLTKGALESLAKQTWTEDGWLKYVTSFSSISRASDGIAGVKTCFLDIPSKGAINIQAIAGYRLKSPISCHRVNQYNYFSMGTVEVPTYFNSFLDYAPYTEIVLNLPFSQPVKIPPEIVVGKTISLNLGVDLMTDAGVYTVTCDSKVIAQVPVNIFINIPFASSEYSQSAQSALLNYISNAGGIGSNIGSIVSAGSVGGVVGGVIGGIATTATSVMSESLRHEESRHITQISQGGGGGGIGAMCAKYAFLQISRPYVPIPPRYYELNGCPSGYTVTIGSCKGYFEVGAIYGTITCNEQEYAMITEMLAGGVFP